MCARVDLRVGVADYDQVALLDRPLGTFRILLNDRERDPLGKKLARHGAAHPAGTADDVVVFQLGQFTLHASPSQEVSQLEL
jgi:hypothetical protein